MSRIPFGRTSILLFLGFSILLAGCSPGVRSARFEDFAPRPSDHAIRLYSESRPECAFREIGMVQVTKGTIFVSMDEVTAALREEARMMGGDAVIGVSQGGGERVRGLAGDELVTVGTETALAGTVIRFTEEDCLDGRLSQWSNGA